MHQLAKEGGPVRLATVQARLCQCYWLLGRSRVNHCWDLFGSTARLAFALGLHRKHIVDQTQRGTAYIDIDCGRRTFWSAYYLDMYLTVTLGRPRMFHNEDVDQELPSDVDDLDLCTHQFAPQDHPGYPIGAAPVAFYECISTTG